MAVQLRINAFGSEDRNRRIRDVSRHYVSLARSLCAAWSDDGVSRSVTVQNENTATGGQLRFASDLGAMSANLELALPADGTQVFFLAAGAFDDTTERAIASTADRDAAIEVVDSTTGISQVTERLMVRVRKNANEITPEERDRFLSALVTLNQRGDFADFQNMHTSDTSLEIHSRSCFLPWHRVYLLDLERKLQAIDPSVTLPYWRFDQAAPQVFTPDFIGTPDAAGLVQFSISNPLLNWQLSVFGEANGRIRRVPSFDPSNEGAGLPGVPLLDQAATINLGTNPNPPSDARFEFFERMEGNPHGIAHVSFDGQIADIGRAPADPLFFMLHCNVDRLWARFQWLRDLYDPSLPATYPRQGSGPFDRRPGRSRDEEQGNFLDDSLWPWNGLAGDTRPRTAPGTYFPVNFLDTPQRYPILRDGIDFQGQVNFQTQIGFSYDDIPLDLTPPSP